MNSQKNPRLLSQIDIKKVQLELELEAENNKLMARRSFYPDVQFSYFKDILTIEGNLYYRSRGETTIFELTPDMDFIVQNLYKHLIGDKTFEIKSGIEGDLYKGIIISGVIGCGKTSLNIAYLRTMEYISDLGNRRPIIVKYLYPDTLADSIKQNGIQAYQNGILHVDDICRDPQKIKDFGNEILPLTRLIEARYHSPFMLFGTTNFTPEDIEKRYGTYIASRLFARCNYMALRSESKRPIQSNISLDGTIEI